MLIGLSGYARSGKDTVAECLVKEHGFTRIAFADALRDALYALNPLIQQGYYADTSRVQDIIDSVGWETAKTEHPEIRSLLQRLGTEVGRELLGPNVWVDIAMCKAAEHERVVFTDVRFPNEADAIEKRGGFVVRIARPGFGPVNGHPSETALDLWPFYTQIHNSGSLEYLAGQVEAVVDHVSRVPR